MIADNQLIVVNRQKLARVHNKLLGRKEYVEKLLR